MYKKSLSEKKHKIGMVLAATTKMATFSNENVSHNPQVWGFSLHIITIKIP